MILETERLIANDENHVARIHCPILIKYVFMSVLPVEIFW